MNINNEDKFEDELYTVYKSIECQSIRADKLIKEQSELYIELIST